MKKILLYVLLCISVTVTAADDVIILKNSTRIDAHLEEVSDTKVSYKKSNYLDGPSYVVETSQISLIILANGDVINYANYQANATPQQTANTRTEQKQVVASNKSISKTTNTPISFNPIPTDNRLFGINLGYMIKDVRRTGSSIRNYSLFGKRGEACSAFQLGLVVQPEIKYGIGIKTGINFEIGHEIGAYGITNQLELIDLNLSIPVQLSYRMEVYKGLSVMVFTGPTFDFGLYASEKIGGTRYANCENLYQYTDRGYKDYQGFNCLWAIGAAIQYKGLRFTIAGDYGMYKENKFCEQYNYWAYVDKPLVLSLGYMFNTEKSKK